MMMMMIMIREIQWVQYDILIQIGDGYYYHKTHVGFSVIATTGYQDSQIRSTLVIEWYWHLNFPNIFKNLWVISTIGH